MCRALILLAVMSCAAIRAQDIEGWVLLTNGENLEGTFHADRRWIALRDPGTGAHDRVGVDSIRRVHLWPVDQRRLSLLGPAGDGGEAEPPDSNTALFDREFLAEIELSDGAIWYSGLELVLTTGGPPDRRREIPFTGHARASAPENGDPEFTHVAIAAFGEAAKGLPGENPPRLSGRLDPEIGCRRVVAVRRESDLVAEGSVAADARTYAFESLLPGTYDLILVGSASIECWLEPCGLPAIGPEEDDAVLEGWAKALAIHEENVTGGSERRYALLRGRASRARGLIYEGRWRWIQENPQTRIPFHEEHAYLLWFAHRFGTDWRVDRRIELDRAVGTGDSDLPRKELRLNQRLAGIRIERGMTRLALDLVED